MQVIVRGPKMTSKAFDLVTANGGLIALAGSQMVALAAKHHSTPVVVLTGLFKLSPLYPHNRDSFNIYLSPERCIKYSDGENDDLVGFAG